MKDYAKKFQPDIEEFREATNAFYEKNLSVAAYKKISGGFGSYAQRGGESGMLRLRLTGGRITKEQLKFICDSIQTYKISRLHLTTCQTVQLHNLKADVICALIEDAWAHGIITRGGGRLSSGSDSQNKAAPKIEGLLLQYAKRPSARYISGSWLCSKEKPYL